MEKIAKIDGNPEYKYKDIKLHEFKNERELQQMIYNNINDVMKTVFDEDVETAEMEYRICDSLRKLGNAKIGRIQSKIDIFVQCKSGNNYLLEVKSSRKSEKGTIKAISQLLYYSILMENRFDNLKLVVISSKYENYWQETVNKYNIPIDFVLVADNQMLLLNKEK